MGGLFGSSSGAHGSGTVEYPTYLKDHHENLLDYLYNGSPGPGGILAIATASNPFLTATPYNPSYELTELSDKIALLSSYILSYSSANTYGSNIDNYISYFDSPEDYIFPSGIISTITDMTNLFYDLDTNIFSTSHIDVAVDAFANDLDEDLDNRILPRFKRGMQDLNTDMSSAFVIGEALIINERTRRLNDFAGKLYIDHENRKLEQEKLKASFNDVYLRYEQVKLAFDDLEVRYHEIQSKFSLNKDLILKDKEKLGHTAITYVYDYQKAVMQAYATLSQICTEYAKIKIISNKEYYELGHGYDEKSSRWQLDIMQTFANMIGAIAGTAVSTPDRASTAKSALGGLASGAGAGYLIGNAPGAIIGGALGFVGGLLD